jgi:hypothetical protein
VENIAMEDTVAENTEAVMGAEVMIATTGMDTGTITAAIIRRY